MKRKTVTCLPIVMATWPFVAGLTLAADRSSADQTSSAGESSMKLEEIVVTAQRRSESLQTVPISVVAINEAALKDANITNVVDLPALVSGLRFSTGGGVATVFMRGIGNQAVTPGNESSVAVYIDEIYYSRLAAGLLELNNIRDIEVLKGPQGTLFGRNADAGVISVTTATPSRSPTLHVDAGYGNYNTAIGNLYAATGFGDKIQGDIAFHITNQQNGWGQFVGGAPYGYLDTVAVRSKWIFSPTDSTKITLIADHANDRTTAGLIAQAVEGTTSGTPPLNPPYTVPLVPNPRLGFYDSIVGPNIFILGKDSSNGVSVKFEQDFSNARFVSISSYRRSTGEYDSAGDFSIANSFQAYFPYFMRQATQEFRLASTSSSSFDWQAGLFYMHLVSGYDTAREVGPYVYSILGAPLEVDFSDSARVNSYAAYTQETFHLSAADNITAGLRYTEDKDAFEGSTVLRSAALGITVPTPPLENKSTFPKITYRVAYDHRFDENLMAYVSYSRGFKTGTYNTLPPTATPALSEQLDTVELGAKTTFFDQRLRINPALFYNKIKNPQVQEDLGISLFLVNAGAAKTYGFDLDGEGILTDHLLVDFSLEYLHAVYTQYENAPGILPALPYGNGQFFPFDAAGKDLPKAPHLSFNIGLKYTIPTTSGDWKLSGNYAYNSGFVFYPDNVERQGAFGLLDASATYVPPGNHHWNISVWGKNLTGKRYYSDEVEFTGASGFGGAPAAPRTFGFRASYDF
jgi:iron complex outermembrane receptor protein